jgi:peptidoglycan/LPS O-acetylase OafA/YrhL
MKNDPLTDKFRIGDNGRAYLDVLRFLAANLVLLQHTSSLMDWNSFIPVGPRGIGSLGVLIFFLISGFLIHGSCWNRWVSGRSGFYSFLVDRFARIMTPYAPILILIALANFLFPVGEHHQEGTASGWVAFFGNLCLLQEYPFFQIASKFLPEVFRIRCYNTAESFWTIPIEAFIYVVFGIMFFVWIHRQKISRVVLMVLLLIAGPVFLYHLGAGFGHGLTVIWLLGALGSFILCRKLLPSEGWRKTGWALLVITFLGALLHVGKDGWNPYDQGFGILIGVMLWGAYLLVESLPAIPQGLGRFCELAACYSYSLYLVHNTILCYCSERFPQSLGIIPRSLLAILLAHLAAIFCYLCFERWYHRVGSFVTSLLKTIRSSSSI